MTPPPFNLELTYKDSTQTTPLIFVLSPGSNPLPFLVNLAESKKKKLLKVSLGQGQGIKAETYIKEAVK